MIGVFCSLDLVIFYLFFESWFNTNVFNYWYLGRTKEEFIQHLNSFYLLYLAQSLLLVAIIVIYWLTGTTDITEIYEIKIPKEYQNILWLAFFSSFAVKMPMWPVHTWLPDAHVEAPVAGSVILAAIHLKMAGYGFLRFSIPMFLWRPIFHPLIFTLSILQLFTLHWWH